MGMGHVGMAVMAVTATMSRMRARTTLAARRRRAAMDDRSRRGWRAGARLGAVGLADKLSCCCCGRCCCAGFPALSAATRDRGPAVEVAAELFGRKSAGAVRTCVRELVEIGDVEKKSRDAGPWARAASAARVEAMSMLASARGHALMPSIAWERAAAAAASAPRPRRRAAARA